MVYEAMTKEELLMELYRLQKKLGEYQDKYGILEETDPLPILDIDMTDEDKIAVYMDYFKGREDAYAERYQTDEGKKGYSLACKNKWKPERGCDIRKSHCKNCLAYAPIGLDAKGIRDHMLDVRRMKGLYPIVEGHYVYFLVFDLDKASYLEDAKKLRITLQSLSIEPLLERSQSGHGIHVWVFFEQKTKASDARKIANYVLTKAMDTFGGFGLDSYDRVFPAQDKVDKGGFGNCIALPLNATFAKEGKTVFLGNDLEPVREQIKYLSSIPKVSKGKVEELVEFASRMDEYGLLGLKALKMPLSKDDFAEPVHINVSGDIYIPLLDLRSRGERFLVRLSSMLNKEYFKLVSIRGNLRNVPRFLYSFKKDERFFRLPRGYKDCLVSLFKSKGIPYVLSTTLCRGEYLDCKLRLSLRQEQVTLLNKVEDLDTAVIAASTGFGKTVIGAALIEMRKTNTLIIVPSVNLLSQWIAKLNEYLECGEGMLGHYSGKGDRTSGVIDVVTIQSLVRNDTLRKKAKNYGMVLVDEAHHMAAEKYEDALRSLAPKYLYGLTATPERADEKEEFVYRSIGPLVRADEGGRVVEFLKYYHPRFTKFSSLVDKGDIAGLLTEATRDKERNRLIKEDVLDVYGKGGKILLLTERIEHAKFLFESLKGEVERLILLYGAQNKAEREAYIETLNSYGDAPFVVVSIGKFIGEGFDDKRFNALFITYPFRWKGILAQYCGRLQRKDTAVKRVDVYDYVDPLVPSFSRMYRAREKGYFELGHKLVGLDPKYKSEILSGDNYQERMMEDCRAAKDEALCFVSYCHLNRLRSILSSFNVPFSCYVAHTLDGDGLSGITYVDEPLPNALIIDRRIVYYGGINPFMYGQKEETIMRIEDPTLAQDIRSALLTAVCSAK